MTVYIVTTGEYSDYSISRVFLDETMANTFAALVYGSIEPWEISIGVPQKVYETRVRMNKQGDVIGTPFAIQIWDDAKPRQDYPTWGDMQFFVRTDDITRAIKVANERRLMLLDSGTWPAERSK
jgi:hypothetical protein